MSYIIDGVNGRDWQGANWAFYNLSEVLVPALRESLLTKELAERIEAALDASTHYIDFSDLLQTPEVGWAWASAIDRVINEFHKQDKSKWRDPSAFKPFIAKVEELKALATNTNSPESKAA